MNFKLFFSLLLLIGAGSVFSQNSSAPVLKENPNGDKEEFYKVDDIRGTINRKAVYLPKPPFPREALEAGADGTVKVQIVLDAEGAVIEAKAISGNPLLYPISEETARKTKFRKIETNDPNAKETGTLTYNFVIEKLGWTQIGFDLSGVQKAPTLRFLVIPRIVKAFQPEWKDELEMLGKLAEMRRVEMETQNASANKPVLLQKSDQSLQSSVKAEIRLPIPNPPTAERIELSQNLIASLQNRLANDALSLWKFNLGLNLLKAFDISRNPNQGRSAAQSLRQSLETAPSDVSADTLPALQKLIEIFESERRTAETANEISKSVTILFRDK